MSLLSYAPLFSCDRSHLLGVSVGRKFRTPYICKGTGVTGVTFASIYPCDLRHKKWCDIFHTLECANNPSGRLGCTPYLAVLVQRTEGRSIAPTQVPSTGGACDLRMPVTWGYLCTGQVHADRSEQVPFQLKSFSDNGALCGYPTKTPEPTVCRPC